MPIAEALRQCLEQNNINYEILPHAATSCASQTAEAAHVSSERIAKGVLMKTNKDYALAVLPASHHVLLREIGKALEFPVTLASEQELGQIFGDCLPGAIPPVGGAYGLEAVVDEKLYKLEDVYFEGGDHTSLVHVDLDGFGKLMAGARQAPIAEHD